MKINHLMFNHTISDIPIFIVFVKVFLKSYIFIRIYLTLNKVWKEQSGV